MPRLLAGYFIGMQYVTKVDDLKGHRYLLGKRSYLLWANKWQINFNPDKCEVMRITHRKDKTKLIYSLGGQFTSVENTKDLGVTISSDLSWGKHVFAKGNKANIVLGIIKRSIGTNNRDVFSQLYNSLVWPILEYTQLLFGART